MLPFRRRMILTTRLPVKLRNPSRVFRLPTTEAVEAVVAVVAAEAEATVVAGGTVVAGATVALLLAEPMEGE